MCFPDYRDVNFQHAVTLVSEYFSFVFSSGESFIFSSSRKLRVPPPETIRAIYALPTRSGCTYQLLESYRLLGFTSLELGPLLLLLFPHNRRIFALSLKQIIAVRLSNTKLSSI